MCLHASFYTEKASLEGQREKYPNKSAVPKNICTLFFNAGRSIHGLRKGETTVLIPQAVICTFVLRLPFHCVERNYLNNELRASTHGSAATGLLQLFAAHR